MIKLTVLNFIEIGNRHYGIFQKLYYKNKKAGPLKVRLKTFCNRMKIF
ncbi:hypothetical protein LEP1GSC073_4378 [Leptospira noguchii str. Cascata]|nr:hypothetical protein LEP1GSC073_4378 [Leptospira noguchii str. Cascata]